MDKKLLNKVMKKLASSNVVISPTVKSSSPSLSMQKKPEMEHRSISKNASRGDDCPAKYSHFIK